MRSMTGFGSGVVEVPGREGSVARVQADVRAVNHRFVDIHARMPVELQQFQAQVEELIRTRVARGRIELQLRIEGEVDSPPQLDVDRARAAYEQLRTLRDAIAPEEAVPLQLLASVPGLFRPGARATDDATLREGIISAVEEALQGVETMRLREGRATAQDLSHALENLRARIAQLRVLSPRVGEAYRKRLHERLGVLLAGSAHGLDDGRLEQEVAIFADRADVTEELARLGAHCDQFGEIMLASGASHGRKLEFLLQEMGREVNTLGAKVPDAEIRKIVVAMKSDLEKMREQAANIL